MSQSKPPLTNVICPPKTDPVVKLGSDKGEGSNATKKIYPRTGYQQSPWSRSLPQHYSYTISTSEGTPDEYRRAMKAGASDFVTKDKFLKQASL